MPTAHELSTPEWWLTVEDPYALHRMRYGSARGGGCPSGSCLSHCLWHQYRMQHAQASYVRNHCSIHLDDGDTRVSQLIAIFTEFKASLSVPVPAHHWTPAEINSWISDTDRTIDDLARPLVKMYEYFLNRQAEVPNAITRFFNFYRTGEMNRNPAAVLDLTLYLLDYTVLLSEIANRGG